MIGRLLRMCVMGCLTCCFLILGCEIDPDMLQNNTPYLVYEEPPPTPAVAALPSNLLFIAHCDYYQDPVARLYFKPLPEMGAASYTIQSSIDGNVWSDFMVNGLIFTITDQSAIGIDPRLTEDCYFRIRINGGEYDEQTSNTMWAKYAPQGGYLHHSTLDTSLHLTGVMSPSAGHGIEVGIEIRTFVSATDFSLNPILPDAIGSWTWYRVNPLDFDDKTLIVGANTHTYTTTNADIGKLIMVEASGDGSSFYGLVRIKTLEIVQ